MEEDLQNRAKMIKLEKCPKFNDCSNIHYLVGLFEGDTNDIPKLREMVCDSKHHVICSIHIRIKE